ncbi:hypothetical protein CYLTODRAFT_426460 [Cylindrobasidium torrendii FP15055 ss-10]|uniref:DUF7918 domain-containing protein n=1 Tax=Cylindrobasidium torrendii FP15055 ss-10 TaxID=1314674 RepID=A0A0D7B0G3_9AGAR|nr:hypothetical protein CYLTODRAFT_426460 [Cylindrobasidium torrendii FP15055 ss-10]
MILPTGLQAWICVDGVRCEEFQETVSENGRDVTCWIPSEAGKTFTVHWTDSPGRQTAYGLSIDGAPRGGRACVNPTGRPVKYTKSGERISATAKRPYLFAPIQQSDDDDLLLNSIEGVGEIKIQANMARFRPSAPVFRDVGAQKTFHERTKKGIDHQTSFGAARYSRAKSLDTYIPIPLGPPSCLIFKYRPMNVLQANGITPPSKFVDVKHDKKPEIYNGDSEVEIIEVKPKVSVKRERKRKASSPDPLIKDESSPQHKRVKREPMNSKNDDIIYISD